MAHKTGLLLCTTMLFLTTQPVSAQHDIPHDIPHHIDVPAAPPPPPPAAVPPMAPPPTSVPTPNQFNLAPPPTEASAKEKMGNIKEQIKDLSAQAEKLRSEIYDLEYYQDENGKLAYKSSAGSLEEAEMYLEVYKKHIPHYIEHRDRAIEYLADLLDKKAKGEYYERWQIEFTQNRIASAQESIAYCEQQVEYWSAEAGSRSSKEEQIAADLAEKHAALAEIETQLKELYKERDKTDREIVDAQRAEALRLEQEELASAKPDIVSAGDLGADDFFGGTKTGTSAETANVTPDRTLQELREDSLQDAFSDLRTLEFQTGFLETADVAGQVTQTIVGFVPSATVADVALTTARGFAEALGEEMAKGTSWDDALKIASVNAGMKGTVSFIGNKLTAGADGMANRVAVLSEVGFTKLSTKQIAEAGSKGISFLVVKTTQTGTQELVGEFAGKPAMKKVAEWVKDDKNTGKSTGSSKLNNSGGYGGGYGSSHATQPLVAY